MVLGLGLTVVEIAILIGAIASVFTLGIVGMDNYIKYVQPKTSELTVQTANHRNNTCNIRSQRVQIWAFCKLINTGQRDVLITTDKVDCVRFHPSGDAVEDLQNEFGTGLNVSIGNLEDHRVDKRSSCLCQLRIATKNEEFIEKCREEDRMDFSLKIQAEDDTQHYSVIYNDSVSLEG